MEDFGACAGVAQKESSCCQVSSLGAKGPLASFTQQLASRIFHHCHGIRAVPRTASSPGDSAVFSGWFGECTAKVLYTALAGRWSEISVHPSLLRCLLPLEKCVDCQASGTRAETFGTVNLPYNSMDTEGASWIQQHVQLPLALNFQGARRLRE